MIRIAASLCAVLVFFLAGPARAQVGICEPDAVQASGSIYRICMPTGGYNGNLIVWAHGFQDSGTPVGIPQEQLCGVGFCINDLANILGFGFATNSYSKTGLAIVQGKADLLDLVDIYKAKKGAPGKTYLVGASEGGIITALSLEQNANVYSAGLAACGPIGNFPFQINYFGDARATFEYFFPGVIPGNPFDPDPWLVANWTAYYNAVVKPYLLHPGYRNQLDQWARVAKLPFDADNYLATVENSAKDALRYAVVNLRDASATLGGFPYFNRDTVYTGSDNDALLNASVRRLDADGAALVSMVTRYTTYGLLTRPLITLHTLRDQQIPYIHEDMYSYKTFLAGTLFSRHLNLSVDRYGHCNFTPDELLYGFIVMLIYDGLISEVSGVGSFLTPAQADAFAARAQAGGIPFQIAGPRLAVKLRTPGGGGGR